MRKLEEFVFEKLKVTKHSGEVSIKTTFRKFMSWWTDEDEFSINKFNIENRNFVSSDKSMSKEDITDFLYKHLNDTIYIKEEEKRARDESRNALYNYSFDIEGITFSIDARIYYDNELLSNSKDYIIEKLKVSKKSSDLLHIKLRDFVTWYMYDNAQWNATDLQTVKFALDEVNKYFNSSYNRLYDFICKHIQDVIYVYEEETDDSCIYKYSFELDEIPFNITAYIEDNSELLSKQWRLLVEKLKVNKNPINGDFKSTMKNFFLWYWDYETTNDYFWDNLYTIEFDNDVINDNFNNDMDEFLDWFKKHMDDIVYFDEVKSGRAIYEYTFYCDGMEFVIKTEIEVEYGLEPFSKSQYIIRNVHEKLKVNKNPINGDIESTMKDFFLWHCDEDDTTDDFWEFLSMIEFENDVIEKNFNNMSEFADWFEPHMDDTVYFDEVQIDKETYKYTFDCDGMEFVIEAWVSTDSTPFSKSQYVIRNLHEKLKVTNKNYDDILLVKLEDFITWYRYTPNWDADYFRNTAFAKDVTQKYFNGSYNRLYDFIIKHRKEVIAVSEEKT